MFCNACGSEIRDDARFCTKCGHEVTALAQAATDLPQQTAEQMAVGAAADTFYRVNKLNYLLDSASAELERLRGTQRWCRVCAVLMGALGALWVMPIMFSSTLHSAPPAAALAFSVFAGVMVAISFAPLPYGIAGVHRWVSDHGFFVFGTWVVLIMLFAVVLTVAIFAGIPYALILRRKIREGEDSVRRYSYELRQLGGLAATVA